MKFIETHVFTESVLELLTDEEYRALQVSLLLRPTQGSLIPGTGGLRKIRAGAKHKGKRGGLRVIYYWHGGEEIIYLLLAYHKSQTNDLTAEQTKTLSNLVRENLK